MQPRFERRTGSAPFTLVEQPRFRAGFDFLRLRADAGELDPALAAWWEQFSTADLARREALIESVKPTGATRKAPGPRRRVPAGAASEGSVGAPLQRTLPLEDVDPVEQRSASHGSEASATGPEESPHAAPRRGRRPTPRVDLELDFDLPLAGDDAAHPGAGPKLDSDSDSNAGAGAGAEVDEDDSTAPDAAPAARKRRRRRRKPTGEAGAPADESAAPQAPPARGHGD